MRPSGLDVNYVGDDGALGGKITRLGGYQAPLGLIVALGIGPRRSVRLRIIYVVDAEKVVFSWVNGVERQCSD